MNKIRENLIDGHISYIYENICLEKKSTAVEWHNEQRKNHFVLFAINGFSDELMQIAQKRSDLILIP